MENRWNKAWFLIGFFSSVGSMVLWVIFNFLNPSNHESVEIDVLLNTFLTLFVPAYIALTSSLKQESYLMYIAFVWSLPISFYMILTPSIFKMFGLTSLLYLVSAILMSFHTKVYKKQ